jgi:hypothetical protein
LVLNGGSLFKPIMAGAVPGCGSYVHRFGSLGFSGGKDSSVLLDIVLRWPMDSCPEAAEECPERVVVIYSDTLLEPPVLRAYARGVVEAVNRLAASAGLHVRAVAAEPARGEDLVGMVVVRGYPAPSPRFRWCTDMWEIEHSVGYYFYSLLTRVEKCLLAVVCCIDSYALRAIDTLLPPSATAIIFYSKLSGHYTSQRINLVEIDNHYKHFLLDDWAAVKGTMNINYYELEAASKDELEIEYLHCPEIRHGECRVYPAVLSKITWALHARPNTLNILEKTGCRKILNNLLALFPTT